jgi:ABC-2 type transport system ATP-binding protein
LADDPVAYKRQFGYLPDNPSGFDYLTGNEFIRMNMKIRGESVKDRKMVKVLSGKFGIEKVLSSRMSDYSRGSRQKVAYICALLGAPKVLIIDEPVSGLDPVSLKVFGESLQERAKSGVSVLMVTHTLDFASRYADKVGMLVDGKIVGETKVKKGMNVSNWFLKKAK